MTRNRVEIEGRIAASDGLRRTPAGLPCLQLRIQHQSPQREAGVERKVECEVETITYGEPATALAIMEVGTAVRLAGFLERKSLRDPRPILHVTEYEIKE